MHDETRQADPLAEDARHSWLDHPRVAQHYRERGFIDGLPWEEWVSARLGAPPQRSLDLKCGTGLRSLYLFEQRLARAVDGIDASEDQILAAEANRALSGAPGSFWRADLNSPALPRATYDLVFACHCLHEVAALEHLLDQVHAALSPKGLFVVEGYVGPSRFQWTEAQMALVTAALSCLPEPFRMMRWDVPKLSEGRPDRDAVIKQSPFEAIRSGEIAALFDARFHTVTIKRLGGTLQNLLYNGIIHNFPETAADAGRVLDVVGRLEDTLVDTGLLPSDFVLMVGSRR